MPTTTRKRRSRKVTDPKNLPTTPRTRRALRQALKEIEERYPGGKPDQEFHVQSRPEIIRRLLTEELQLNPSLGDAEVTRQVDVAMRMLGFSKEKLHPYDKRAHYNMTRLEVIEIIDDHGLDFYRGNVLKYCLRAPHTPDVLDQLKKAQYYLNRLVTLTQQGKGPLAGYLPVVAMAKAKETP